MTEQQYMQLRDSAVRMAFKIIKNSDDAEDVAQEALLKLMMMEKEIENPSAWITTVVRNQSLSVIKKKSKTIQLTEEKLVYETPAQEQDDEELPDLDTEHVKSLISASDFRVYKMMLKYKTVKAYATAAKKKYSSTAAKVQRMKQNLVAAYNRDKQIVTGINLLTYKEARSCREMLKILPTISNSEDMKKHVRYFEQYEGDSFNLGIDNIRAWNIHLKRDINVLYITFENKSQEIENCQIDFIINKLNRIKIKAITKLPTTHLKVIDKEEFLRSIESTKSGIYKLNAEKQKALAKLLKDIN